MGRVIRRESLAEPPRFAFEDIEGRARQILDDARAQAADIVAAAEAQAAEIEQAAKQAAAEARKTAHETGLKEGCEQGERNAREDAREAALTEVRQEAAQATEALRAGLDRFDRDKRSLLALAESGLIRLALEIARRVCAQRLDVPGNSPEQKIRELLDTVRHDGDIVLKLHPVDYESLTSIAPELVQTIDALGHVRLESDEALVRGDCLLETRDGVIDAGLTTQLDRIATAICDEIPGGSDTASAGVAEANE